MKSSSYAWKMTVQLIETDSDGLVLNHGKWAHNHTQLMALGFGSLG